MATKKLDKEHVESIKTLRNNFNQNAMTLGSIAIDEQMIKMQLKQIEEARVAQLEVFEKLRTEETELMTSLKERYGEGEINIIDGTFTPAE
jgi:hypothetical protein